MNTITTVHIIICILKMIINIWWIIKKVGSFPNSNELGKKSESVPLTHSPLFPIDYLLLNLSEYNLLWGCWRPIVPASSASTSARAPLTCHVHLSDPKDLSSLSGVCAIRIHYFWRPRALIVSLFNLTLYQFLLLLSLFEEIKQSRFVVSIFNRTFN